MERGGREVRRSSRRRHTRCLSDWSSDVCSSDLLPCRLFEFVMMCFITLLEVLLIRSHEYRSGTEKQTQGGKALVVVKTSYEKQVGFWVRASLASDRKSVV